METECILPHSQVPAKCPYPEPDRTSHRPHIPLPEDPSSYYRPIYAWVFQVVVSLRIPHQIPEYTHLYPSQQYTMTNSNYEATVNATFSKPVITYK
jgi:hypothetical protein